MELHLDSIRGIIHPASVECSSISHRGVVVTQEADSVAKIVVPELPRGESVTLKLLHQDYAILNNGRLKGTGKDYKCLHHTEYVNNTIRTWWFALMIGVLIAGFWTSLEGAVRSADESSNEAPRSGSTDEPGRPQKLSQKPVPESAPPAN